MLDDEDLLANPLSIKFSLEIDTALKPSLGILTELLNNPDSVKAEDTPVLHYARQPSGNKSTSHLHKAGMIPFRGDVSVLDQARAMNWFEMHVPDARTKRCLWITQVPFAHTVTVLLASQHHEKFSREPEYPSADSSTKQEHFILNKAWEYQMKTFRKDWDAVDVDKESLCALEESMFEVSKQAGHTGYYQWGLDAGDHQDKWFPYANVPDSWNHRDGEFEDSDELQVRCST